MSHIQLTQTRDNVKKPIVVKCSDVSYTNPANDDSGDTFINLNGAISIRVDESATAIYEKLQEQNITYLDLNNLELTVRPVE